MLIPLLANNCPEAFCFRTVHVGICAWSYTKCLWTWYLTNRLWEFYQIYNFDAVVDRDELIRFWNQKVEGHRQQEHIWSNKHFRRHFLTYLWRAWTHFNETYRSYSMRSSRNTDDILKVMGLKVKVTDNSVFGDIPIRILSSKTQSCFVWK